MELNKEFLVILLLQLVGITPLVHSCYPNTNHFSLDDDVIRPIFKCSEDQVRDPFTQLCVSCEEDELFFKKTKRCYKHNENDPEQGPCSQNMYLVKHPEKPTLGHCQCRNNETRALIYDKRTNQCHFVYSQGPCRRGKWLTLINDIPRCELNPCVQLQQGNRNDEFVRFRGACVKLGDTCDTSGKVSFIPGNITPQCQSSPKIILFAFGAIPTRCPENTYLSYNGKCQRSIDVDF